MAKTIYLNQHSGISYGYAVNTTVSSAQILYNTAQPPVAIGTLVTPASIAGISVNQLLSIGGAQVTVSGVSGGSFTYSPIYLPVAGTSIRTPWLTIGLYRYTMAPNNFTFSYYAPAEHDLYFGTLKAPDAGEISIYLDGNDSGPFSLYSSTAEISSVLLQQAVPAGEHTLTVTAGFTDPGQHFVYFHKLELAEHIPQTGGFYSHLGPAGTLEDSTNNFLGNWSTAGDFAYTPTPGSSVFFYPQLGADGEIKIRVQKTPDSGIIAVLKDGVELDQIDLYADPGVNPTDITLFSNPATETGLYQVELRLLEVSNVASTGTLFYFRGSVVSFSRTDLEALILSANYLMHVANSSGDGAFSDTYDSSRINFDATSLYACIGLLAAYQVTGNPDYLLAVRNFLLWFAQMQMQAPSDPFSHGAWNIGYQRLPTPTPTYIPAIAPYDAQGISEIRWVDAVQCLPAFVLYWYATLANDEATKAQLLPAFSKGIEGFIRNNYDPNTGFFFSSWQFKSSPTIFLYHDAVAHHSPDGTLLELYNDSDGSFFTYGPTGAWSSYGPASAVEADEHYTLASDSYIEFTMTLDSGDQVRWITQTAWDVGIAEVLLSTDGTTFTPIGTVDCYSTSSQFQNVFAIYTAAATGNYWFRIRHTGTINAGAATATGWQRLSARYSAGQTDVLLGLLAMWKMTRKPRYANLASRLIRRFGTHFWSSTENRWAIALEGAAPGSPNLAWYPFPYGYTAFGQGDSRFFKNKAHLSQALDSLQVCQDEEGGFRPPGFLEAEHIFSTFYMLGRHQSCARSAEPVRRLGKNVYQERAILPHPGR